MSKILVINKDKSTSAILSNLLKTEGYKVVACDDATKGRGQVEAEEFSLLICNLSERPEDAETIRLARAKRPSMPVIAITEAGVQAETAAGLGVFASMGKPLKIDALLSIVQKAVDYNSDMLSGGVNLNLKLETCYQYDLVAESPQMKSVCQMISRVAATDVAVLVLGEQGTGKEAVASVLHANSKRKDKDFVSVNCADPRATSQLLGPLVGKTALERVNQGTLFLKEVSALPLPVQSGLYHALHERKFKRQDNGHEFPVDARLVVSSSHDLDQMVTAGKFSKDLYRMFKVIVISVPPLRERLQDAMPLVRQALKRHVGQDHALPTLSAEVAKVFEHHSWPGNVSEIDRVIAFALKKMKGSVMSLDCLPPELAAQWR